MCVCVCVCVCVCHCILYLSNVLVHTAHTTDYKQVHSFNLWDIYGVYSCTVALSRLFNPPMGAIPFPREHAACDWTERSYSFSMVGFIETLHLSR